ncbi:MAG: phosphotransferase, partial [Rhodocyclaceae bacterium]|nr:phosphotransferase [Rhodocyclaceae bacterium]
MESATDNRNALTPKVVEWVERHIGKVIAIDTQPRWRPMWFVQARREDGQEVGLCVRGSRVDSLLVFPLEHEMRVQKFMHEQGIAVPKVYGWIDDVGAYVMEIVPGSPTFMGMPAEQRDPIMRRYMQELARLHKIDPALAEAAGITGGKTPAEATTVGIAAFEHVYRVQKKRPDPFMEFMLGWLARNPPHAHNRRSLVVWDSGQLHHRDGEFRAIIDVELGHIGDPMMDLAAFRMRNTVLNLGDCDTLYKWYEEAAGEPVDMAAIQFHHIFFTLTNALSFHMALAEPAPESDYMTNTQWINETNLFALEALAEVFQVALPPVDLPAAEVTPSAIPFAHLVRTLRTLEGEADSDYMKYKVRTLFRLARHLARMDEIGRQIVEANLDDIGQLTGQRPATWQDGDAALEAFVLQDQGAHDLALLMLFNKRLNRALAMNGPAGSAMTHHHRIQPFGGKM